MAAVMCLAPTDPLPTMDMTSLLSDPGLDQQLESLLEYGCDDEVAFKMESLVPPEICPSDLISQLEGMLSVLQDAQVQQASLGKDVELARVQLTFPEPCGSQVGNPQGSPKRRRSSSGRPITIKTSRLSTHDIQDDSSSGSSSKTSPGVTASPPASRRNKSQRCSLCKQFGHKSRTCKQSDLGAAYLTPLPFLSGAQSPVV